MRWLFDIDNPIMRYIVKAFDCMCLSVLWLLFSLPVITAGASAAALYTTVYRYIRKGEGHLFRTFWGAFRENWKRSTLVWLVVLVIGALLATDVLVFRTLAIQGEMMGKLYWPVLLLCCVAATWVAFLNAYAARFQGSVRDVLRISFLLMTAHPIKSFTVFVPIAAGILLTAMVPSLLIISPAAVCLVNSLVLEQIFAIHLAAEEETEKSL